MRNILSLTALNAIQATPQEAALYALIGFLVVFVGIALLIAVVWLVGKVLSKTQGGAATVKKTQPVPKQSTKPQSSDEIDAETLAVITAAIMAYYENQGSRCEFVVKRIKRIQRY